MINRSHGGEEMVSIYFARPKPEGLTRLRQIVEELGGQVERPASIEEKIAEERRAAAAAFAARNAPVSYVGVDEHDPVLRAHCRID
jgi:hypothetical protein